MGMQPFIISFVMKTKIINHDTKTINFPTKGQKDFIMIRKIRM